MNRSTVADRRPAGAQLLARPVMQVNSSLEKPLPAALCRPLTLSSPARPVPDRVGAPIAIGTVDSENTLETEEWSPSAFVNLMVTLTRSPGVTSSNRADVTPPSSDFSCPSTVIVVVPHRCRRYCPPSMKYRRARRTVVGRPHVREGNVPGGVRVTVRVTVANSDHSACLSALFRATIDTE